MAARAGHEPAKKRSNIHERSQTDALFLSIGDGVVATDEHGMISRINQVGLDILGYSEEDLLGKWFPEAIVGRNEDESQIELLDRPVSQALLTGHPISTKMKYVAKDGQSVPVFITVAPILVDGKPAGAVEVFRDITHEQEIDRMKSEFISLASHQLRTPLTAIKTYSHLLAGGFKGELNTGQHEFMDIILGAADRMNELISTLLDISKIEEGLLSTSFQMTPVDDLIEELITELHHIAESKRITLTFKPTGSDFTLETDPMLLQEIVSNLLTNAIKYTPSGGSVTILLKSTAKSLHMEVRDTGYGIPAKQQKRVFSKFFRADNIANLDDSGTGLGLYLVKRIADNLGGKIWFKSKENLGSSFYFELPRT